MVKLKTAVTSVTISQVVYDLLASTRGTGVLTGASEVFNLPDVSSNQFTTIFTNTYRVEDVGNLEVLDLAVSLVANGNGNGEWRLQISGNGDIDANYVTVATPILNVGIFTPIDTSGAGFWITSIQTGNSKLAIRLQARAVSGTVNTQIDDRTNIFLLYRKKVLS